MIMIFSINVTVAGSLWYCLDRLMVVGLSISTGVASRMHEHFFGGRSIIGEYMSCYINWMLGVGL